MGQLLRILVAFLVFDFMGPDAQGAPTKGRYMWVRCRPDSRNANCLKEWGPWINLPGPRDRLPPSAVQGIMKASLDMDADGSGASEENMESGSGDQSSTPWGSGGNWFTDWMDLGLLTTDGRVQLEEGSESEGSSFEGSGSEGSSFEGSGSGFSSAEGSGSLFDYTDFVSPEAGSMNVQQNNVPHTSELQVDNFNL